MRWILRYAREVREKLVLDAPCKKSDEPLTIRTYLPLVLIRLESGHLTRDRQTHITRARTRLLYINIKKCRERDAEASGIFCHLVEHATRHFVKALIRRRRKTPTAFRCMSLVRMDAVEKNKLFEAFKILVERFQSEMAEKEARFLVPKGDKAPVQQPRAVEGHRDARISRVRFLRLVFQQVARSKLASDGGCG